MKFKKISIVIPVFNEEDYIDGCLRRVIMADVGGLSKEIIVVDDGSTDDSSKKLKLQSSKFKKKSNISLTVITKKQNEGKGKALRAGFMASTGDIVLVQDADLEYDPADYPTLLEPFRKFDADVVYGSRFISDRPHRVLYFWHFIGNKVLTLIANVLTNLNLTDIYCGFKAFKGNLIREIAGDLKSKGFEIEAELTKKISQIPDLKIYEVGVTYAGRTYLEGKKIQGRDFFSGILSLLFD